MIDRCTRWHAAKVIPNKGEETLTAAIDDLWIRIHGPMKELICDGESGITRSDYANRYLARKGISLHSRGKGQHAAHIERRGALLRETVLKTLSQLREEGIQDTPFEAVLADATFCGNAMLTINQSTPYAADMAGYQACCQAWTRSGLQTLNGIPYWSGTRTECGR